MSKRQVFHVTPDQGDWKVKREGAERASKTFEKKEAAVNYGREKAKNQDLGQVIIHKKDGTIQTEHTYGKDPCPPKG